MADINQVVNHFGKAVKNSRKYLLKYSKIVRLKPSEGTIFSVGSRHWWAH